MEFFPPTSIRLDGGPFAEALQVDLAYVRALETDRLLAPFLSEAGLTPRAPAYGSWEGEGLGGQTGGHYPSALSHLWAATGDRDLRDRLEYAVDELARAQDARGTGYVGGVPGGAALFAGSRFRREPQLGARVQPAQDVPGAHRRAPRRRRRVRARYRGAPGRLVADDR